MRDIGIVCGQHVVVDANPESYLEPTHHSFSLQIPSVDIVSNILSKFTLGI